MPDIIQVESKVIALGEESNDMYMSLDMVFLTSEVNLNHIEFSEDFIYNIELEKYKYIGLPLVCDIAKLEKGEYDKLTHKYSKGKFGTQSIGSFVDFYTQKNGEILELVAKARVWKRNPKTCAALEELYASDEGLKFSYEVLVGKSSKENGITKVPKDDSNNPIGSCVVSTPAVPASRCSLLVAEAYEADFINNEEGEIMSGERNKELTMEEMFKNTKVHMSTEIAELDMSQVQRKIYNAMKEFIKEDWYYYDVVDMTMTYVIVRKYDDADYYKIDYTVSDTTVQLSNMRKVTKTYQDIPEGGDPEMAELKEMQEKLELAEKEIETLKATITTKETEIATVNETLATKETEIAELNSKVTTLSESVIAKDTELAELAPIKEAHAKLVAEKEAVELAERQNALREKYSKLLSAEIIVELAEAINSLDESKLNAKVVELAMAKASETKPHVEVATRITDSVAIGKNDLVSKYITVRE